MNDKVTFNGMVGLFTTPVFLSSINDEQIVDNAVENILKLKNTTDGVDRFGCWVTDDNLHTLPEFKDLTEILLSEAERALDAMTINRDSHYITCMWSNVAPIGTAHGEHIHSNCIYSGVLYLKVPEGCGTTVFSDPRPTVNILRPDYSNPTPYYMGARWSQIPEKGNLIIFPGWLPHSVETVPPIEGSEERITLSFNIMIKSKVEHDTAKIEFK